MNDPLSLIASELGSLKASTVCTNVFSLPSTKDIFGIVSLTCGPAFADMVIWNVVVAGVVSGCPSLAVTV